MSREQSSECAPVQMRGRGGVPITLTPSTGRRRRPGTCQHVPHSLVGLQASPVLTACAAGSKSLGSKRAALPPSCQKASTAVVGSELVEDVVPNPMDGIEIRGHLAIGRKPTGRLIYLADADVPAAAKLAL
jgi:hypothetical protein